MTYIILGAGGHARVVIEALRCCNIQIAGITDRAQLLWGQTVSGLPVLGNDDAVKNYEVRTTALANGLGNAVTRNSPDLEARAAIFEHFVKLGYSFPVVRHPGAIIASDAILAAGSQVMAGAVIQSGAVVGRNVIINSGAVVEHDCIIGDHVHIAPRSVLCGGVKIAALSHIGAGSIVLQNTKVGSRVVIAAGAVLTRDCLDNVLIKR